MATENGTALVVTFGASVLSCQTDSSSLSMTRDLIETTCKDAVNSNKTYIPGEKDGTIEVTAAYDQSATNGFAQVFAIWDSGTETAWKWGSTAAGGVYYEGNALVSDLSPEAPQNDRATYSFTLQITGGIVEATNP
mgnify:CR=1 FL=1